MKKVVWALLFLCLWSTAARAVPANYSLVWSDEFSSWNTANWSKGYPWGDGHTHNHDAYCIDSQVTVADGALKITAAYSPNYNNTGYDYISGIVTTSGKKSWKMGYIEARLKMAGAQGSWPAFWTLQSGWPPEIDIMENPCPTQNLNVYHFYLHHSGGSFGSTYTGSNLSTTYHTYGVEWTSSQMAWYYDGSQVGRWTDAAHVSECDYMYLLINLAVGGWGGTPVAAQYPASYYCDWVRVYQGVGGFTGAGTYKITGKQSGRALDVNMSNSQVILYSYWGGSNQKFAIASTGDGYYTLSPLSATGSRVEVTNALLTNEAYVGIWPSNGHYCQQWQIVDAGGGYYRLINRNSGKSMDAWGSSNLSRIIQYTWYGTDNQLWFFTRL